MTRLISFADGFTSASAPSVSDLPMDAYPLANNVSALTNITGLDFSAYSSVFAECEVERIDSNGTNRQVIDIKFSKNATVWSMDFGSWRGSDLIQPALTSIESVVISITGAGQVQYQSGNMTGTGYIGNFKFNFIKALL